MSGSGEGAQGYFDDSVSLRALTSQGRDGRLRLDPRSYAKGVLVKEARGAGSIFGLATGQFIVGVVAFILGRNLAASLLLTAAIVATVVACVVTLRSSPKD